jgi:hypothetical protein
VLATDEEITSYLRDHGVSDTDIERYLLETPLDSPHRPEIGPDREAAERPRRGRPKKTGKAEAEPGRVTPVAISPAEQYAAKDLLTRIGRDFAENRQKSKSKAFETYQRDLATNSGTLVMGGAVTLKELSVLLMDLESYMKSTVKEGETAATRLQKFLAGELADEE